MRLSFAQSFTKPFARVFLRRALSEVVLRRVVLSVAGVGLLTLSAKVQVPFYPVPMTLQTMALMFIGCFFSRSVAWASLGSYVLLGVLGLPVFAKGGGMVYLLGPTGGYILGFLPAMALFLFARGKNVRSLLALFGGVVVIYACGLAWLGSSIGWEKPLLALGLVPFVGGDIAKAFVVWGMLLLDGGRAGDRTRNW